MKTYVSSRHAFRKEVPSCVPKSLKFLAGSRSSRSNERQPRERAHARGLYNVCVVRLETSNHFYLACCLRLALPLQSMAHGPCSCSRPGLVASSSSRRLVVARIVRESHGIRTRYVILISPFFPLPRNLTRGYPAGSCPSSSSSSKDFARSR